MATKQAKGGDVVWYAKAQDGASTSRAFGYPGAPQDVNSVEQKRVRDYGPLDLRVCYSYHRSNPEAMGEENWRRYAHGNDITWIQQLFGKSQETNSVRFNYELANPKVTNRFLRSDGTLDNMLTHTPSSDWFRDLHASMNMNSSTPGQGVLMVNNNRFATHYN